MNIEIKKNGTVESNDYVDTSLNCQFAGLPSAYTPLEYLQSSGQEHIMLNLTMSDNITKITADMEVLNNNKSKILFGAYDGNSQYFYFNYTENGDTDLTAITSMGGKMSTGVQKQAGRFNSVLIKTDNLVTYIVNGVSVSNTIESNFTGTTSYCLFADNSNGHVIYQYDCKLYSFTVDVDNSLALYLVPAKRNSDNVCGMYDLVNQYFYTNAGGGAFTGNEISFTYSIINANDFIEL